MCKTKDEFDKLVRKQRKLSATKKKIEDQLAAVNDELAQYIQSKGKPASKGSTTLVIFGEDYKASYIIITKHPFDTDKLNAYFGDRVDEYKKESSYGRVDIR